MSAFREQQNVINQKWSKSSGNYDGLIQAELSSFRVERWQNRILSAAPEHEVLDILDTGCGPGFFTMILADKGHKVTGIDSAEGMLCCARENIRRKGYDAEIMEMDCHDLQFPDNTFDLIVSRNVTHTLQDHVKVYREWNRVLRPGGVLLIYDCNWHLVLEEGPLREQYIKDAEKCIRTYGSDFHGTSDPENFVNDSGYRIPDVPHRLKGLQRPDWDIGILKALGYADITFERNITEEVWDEKEKLIYRTTPMFQIRAVKR